MARYVPDRGDVVWLKFSPQAGREHAGTRPAFVLSPKSYNRKVGLALVCPITSKVKGYPFEVELPSDERIHGAVLADQLRSLDWRVRKARFICRPPAVVMNLVQAKVRALID